MRFASSIPSLISRIALIARISRYNCFFYAHLFLRICFVLLAFAQIPLQAQSTPTNTLQGTPQNALPSPLHSAQNPFRDSAYIDSSTLDSYSTFTHRYNTRFDSQHNVNINAFGGQIRVNDNGDSVLQNYGGVSFSYDGLVERYGIGGFASYVFNDSAFSDNASNYTALSPHNTKAHTAILGAYTDNFIDAHHLQARFAQSFNFLDSSGNNNFIYSSTTNFNASYGFVFSLGKGSFIEPYGKFSIASLFAIEKQGENLPNYSLHSHIELGAHFRQYLGNDKVYFFITPRFRQTIGTENNDPFLRVANVDEYGEIQTMMHDTKYRSFGLLLVGIDFRLNKNASVSVRANGKITQNLYSYGGTLKLNIAF